MVAIRETIGRQALIALSNQYASVAEAILEIVDNPFDYRHNRELRIEISVDKPGDRVEILDVGGEGMDSTGLQEWIAWGTGEEHEEGDIGQYHVGGKLAAIYLANSIEIISRRAGSGHVWRFADPEWGRRATIFDGDLEELTRAQAEDCIPSLRQFEADVGFTLVRLRGLKPHRYEVGILETNLSNTYRALLNAGGCQILLNGDSVAPLEIPESATHADQAIEIRTTKLEGGVTVRGRIWVTDRERFRVGRGVGMSAGIRTVFNGRLITWDEDFGHYLAGRGSLQRLVGEIHIQRVRPNTTKNGWDKDSPGWGAIHEFMHDQMQPMVAYLNQLIEARPVTREQRKRAERVRRQIDEALREIDLSSVNVPGSLGHEFDAPAGRRSPTPTDSPTPPAGEGARGDSVERTPPPADPVGRLVRRYRQGVPPIDYDQLGRGPRSDWRDDERERTIVVNTDFPLYQETDHYVLEGALMCLLKEGDEALTYEDALDRLETLIWAATAT